MVEQGTENPCVGSSTLPLATSEPSIPPGRHAVRRRSRLVTMDTRANETAESEQPETRPADRDAFLLPFLVEPRDWCRRLDWSDILPDIAGPVEIDVGAGKGRLLVERAAERPGAGFLGIERQLVRCRRIARRALRRRISTIRLIRADARYVLEYLVPPHSAGRVYVLFPDPWPKKRHQRRRLMQGTIDEVIYRCLVPGGLLHFATDHGPYFRDVAGLFAASPLFEEADAEAPECSRPMTDFEAQFAGEQRPIGRAVYRARPLC